MTKQSVNINYDLGKVPPQAIEFEQAVLGAMMLESRCTDNILSIIKPESFYKDEHQKIFSAIVELRAKSKAIDLLTVTEQLRAMKTLDEVGGPVYVTQLTSSVSSAAHSEFHARVIQDKFIMRELIRLGSELTGLAYDESNDCEDLLTEFTLSLNKLTNETHVENAELLRSLLSKRLLEIEEVKNNPGKLIGVPSGLTSLDRLTGGWQKTDLIILAARPSMGKTSLALNFALEATNFKFPVAFFSQEMSKAQLTDKSISYVADISPADLRSGKILEYQWQQIDNKLRRIEDNKLFIDDTPALTLLQLRAKVAKLLKFNIGLVVIDYLQLMNGKAKGLNRDQEIGELTRGIKQLAKETGIPFIVLSQLSREVEKRSIKRPQLSDLRESGNIEQDADLVLFIFRPEYYGIMEDENGNSLQGVTELIIAKHRNGPIGFVNLYTNEYCSKFTDERNEQIKPLQVHTDFYEPRENEF